MPHSSFLILNYSFSKVLVNEPFQRFYRSGSSQPVLRRVHAVVYQLVDGRYRNVHPRVRRSIIDVHRAVVVGNPAVGEEHVRHVADAFFAFGSHKVAARPES